MSESLRQPIRKFSFQDPVSCITENDIVLCSNSTWGYILAVSSGLATDRGGVLTHEGYVRGVYVRQSMLRQFRKSVCQSVTWA